MYVGKSLYASKTQTSSKHFWAQYVIWLYFFYNLCSWSRNWRQKCQTRTCTQTFQNLPFQTFGEIENQRHLLFVLIQAEIFLIYIPTVHVIYKRTLQNNFMLIEKLWKLLIMTLEIVFWKSTGVLLLDLILHDFLTSYRAGGQRTQIYRCFTQHTLTSEDFLSGR